MNTDIIVATPKQNEEVNLINAAKKGLRGELTELSWLMYDQAITDFFGYMRDQDTSEFGGSIAVAFSSYLKHLSSKGYAPSTVNAKKSQLRRFFQWGVAVGWLDAQSLMEIQQVKSAKGSGGKAGNWLTIAQMQELLDAPDISTLIGRRDKALLAMLMGCAFRRNEVIELTWGQIVRQGETVVAKNVSRKHHRIQNYIAIPTFVMEALSQYSVRGEDNQKILTSYDRHGNARGSLTADGVWRLVRSYTEKLGFGSVAPHDLRRSWARAAKKAGLELSQIQLNLGHASSVTTEKYISELIQVDQIAVAVELKA